MRFPAYVRHHTWATVLILTFAMGDGGMSTLLPPLFRAEGKDPVAIGALIAVPAAIALLMRIPGGMLFRPERARWLMAGSLCISIAGMLLYPLTTSNAVLALIGALYGVGYSTLTTVTLASVIGAIGPDENRGGALGFYVSGLSTGYAVSSSLWGFIADSFGFRAGFFGMASATLLALLIAVFAKFPEQQPSPRSVQAATIPWSRAQTFTHVLLDETVVVMMLGSFFINVYLAQFGTFLPLTLLPLGFSLAQIGALRTMWSLTNALGRVFGGPVLSRIDHRRAQDGSLILQASMLALFAFPLPFAALAPITIVAASGRAICFVANAVALADVDPAKVGRGMASGMMNAAGDLGRIAGPASGGFIAKAAGVQNFWLISPPLYLAIYFGVLLALRWRTRVDPASAAV